MTINENTANTAEATAEETSFKFELLDANTNKVLHHFSTDAPETLVEFYKTSGINFPTLMQHGETGEPLDVKGYGQVIVKAYTTVSSDHRDLLISEIFANFAKWQTLDKNNRAFVLAMLDEHLDRETLTFDLAEDELFAEEVANFANEAPAAPEKYIHPSVIAMDKMIDAVQAGLAIEDEEERNGILGLVAKNTGWHITLEPVSASSVSADAA